MTTEDSPRGSPPDVSRRPAKKMPKRSMKMYEASQKLGDIQKKFGGGGFARVKDQYGKQTKQSCCGGAPGAMGLDLGVGGKAKEVEKVFRKETEVRTAVQRVRVQKDWASNENVVKK